VSKATAFLFTEGMPELMDLESDTEPDTDSEDNSDRDDDLDDSWVGFHGRDGPNIHMVKILLGHGADPYYAISGTCSRQIVIQRLYEPGCPFTVELQEILTVFDARIKETIAPPDRWIGKGKKFFNKKK
jgi:hypothetical protein